MNLRYNCKHRKLGDNLTVKEPIIPIRLVGGNGKKSDFTGVLDSGSDFVLVPKEVAEALEIDYKKGMEITSSDFEGKEFKTSICDIRMEIIKGIEKLPLSCKAAINLTGLGTRTLLLAQAFLNTSRSFLTTPITSFK